jgi:hypothetical protein
MLSANSLSDCRLDSLLTYVTESVSPRKYEVWVFHVGMQLRSPRKQESILLTKTGTLQPIDNTYVLEGDTGARIRRGSTYKAQGVNSRSSEAIWGCYGLTAAPEHTEPELKV